MKFPYFLHGGAAVDPPEIKFLAGTEVFFMSGIIRTSSTEIPQWLFSHLETKATFVS